MALYPCMNLDNVCLKHPKVRELGAYELNVYFCLQSFVMDNVYNELYMVQLTYQQTFVDQRGVVTKHNVVRQMATPPIPRPPFSVNRESPIVLWHFTASPWVIVH